jgi:hypothetical protein
VKPGQRPGGSTESIVLVTGVLRHQCPFGAHLAQLTRVHRADVLPFDKNCARGWFDQPVDMPEPDNPMMQKISPRPTLNVASCTPTVRIKI